MNEKIISDLSQLLKDLRVELEEWEAQKKPSKTTKVLMLERRRFITAIQTIMLDNMQIQIKNMGL